jgi:hypothetical protein
MNRIGWWGEGPMVFPFRKFSLFCALALPIQSDERKVFMMQVEHRAFSIFWVGQLAALIAVAKFVLRN